MADDDAEEGWTLRRVLLVLQIAGAVLVIVLKVLEIARAGRALGIQVPSLGWARWGLVGYLYAYIAFDFYDAWVRDLLDRTLVLITAALAFVALSMLLFLSA
jgi:hypothetical protein